MNKEAKKSCVSAKKRIACRGIVVYGVLLVLFACCMGDALLLFGYAKVMERRNSNDIAAANQILEEGFLTVRDDTYTLANSLLTDIEVNQSISAIVNSRAGDIENIFQKWTALLNTLQEAAIYRDWISEVGVVTEKMSTLSPYQEQYASIPNWKNLEQMGLLQKLRKNVNSCSIVSRLTAPKGQDSVCIAGLANAYGTEWVLIVMLHIPNTGSEDGRSQYVLDEAGNILWKNTSGSFPSQLTGRILSDRRDSGMFSWKADGKRQNVSFRHSSKNGLTFVLLDENGGDIHNLSPVLKTVFLSGAAVLILAGLFLYAAGERLMRPVWQMIERIRNINDFDKRIPEKPSMRKFGNYWIEKAGLRTRMTLLLLFCCMLCTAVHFATVYYAAQKQVFERTKLFVNDRLDQSLNDIDFSLRRCEGNSAQISVDRSVQELLVNGRLDGNGKVRERLLFDGVAHEWLEYIGLFSTAPRSVYSVGSTGLDMEAILKARIQEGGAYNQWGISDNSMSSLYYIRGIRDLESIRPIGYTVITVSNDIILSRMSWLKEFGELGISYDKGGIYLQTVNLPDGLSGGDRAVPEQLVYSRVLNWKFILSLSRGDMTMLFREELASLIPAFSIVALLVLFLALLACCRIVRPINRIRDGVMEIGFGNLDVQIKSGKVGEFERLYDIYDSLIKKFDRLYNELYLQKLSEVERDRKENELKLICLQQQINPHFLYNTLLSASFLIKMQEYKDAERLITELGDMFRAGVYRGVNVVPVKEELAHIRAYLSVQQIRYRDKMTVQWDIEQQLFDYKTLKFILQPVVENAILHGVEESRQNVVITISGRIQKDVLVFQVSDNGPGIPPGELTRINHSLLEPGDYQKIGLKNIDERIKMYFGENYGLTVESAFGEYTCVRIVLPLISKGEDA